MSTEAKAQTVALAANWLSAEVSSNANVNVMCSNGGFVPNNATLTVAGDVVSGTVTGTGSAMLTTNCVYWPWGYDHWRPYYVPVTTYVTSEKVKLKSGEVERLRKAAQRDAKLKTILNKFTPLIEVELEF